MPSLRVTTNQGIEDIAAGEVARLLDSAGISHAEPAPGPRGRKGVVEIELTDDEEGREARSQLARTLAPARSIYHAVIHTGEVQWTGQSLSALGREIAAIPLPAMDDAASFRVTCSRFGDHPFHSPDVERAVGAALQERYGTAVDLEEYEVNVRVDITGEECLCGYQLTGRKGLDRRYKWRFHPRVTLRTTIAFAMLDVAGFREAPGALHDPFCGSGTILLEASGLAKEARARYEGAGPSPSTVSISGSDRSQTAVAGCRENLLENGVEAVTVTQMDAREMAAHLEHSNLDYIVTNPPYGIRMGQSVDFGRLYSDFLHQAAIVLKPLGILVLLVGRRRGRFNKVLQATPEFRLEHVRIIEIGGVYPGLFVLRRTP